MRKHITLLDVCMRGKSINLYKILSIVFWFIRQFFLPNPFAVLGESVDITINELVIAFTPAQLNEIIGWVLPALTGVVVGLFYIKGSEPSLGSFLYMLFFCIHTFVLYLMSWAYPIVFLVVSIPIIYVVLVALWFKYYHDT